MKFKGFIIDRYDFEKSMDSKKIKDLTLLQCSYLLEFYPQVYENMIKEDETFVFDFSKKF